MNNLNGELLCDAAHLKVQNENNDAFVCLFLSVFPSFETIGKLPRCIK